MCRSVLARLLSSSFLRCLVVHLSGVYLCLSLYPYLYTYRYIYTCGLSLHFLVSVHGPREPRPRCIPRCKLSSISCLCANLLLLCVFRVVYTITYRNARTFFCLLREIVDEELRKTEGLCGGLQERIARAQQTKEEHRRVACRLLVDLFIRRLRDAWNKCIRAILLQSDTEGEEGDESRNQLGIGVCKSLLLCSYSRAHRRGRGRHLSSFLSSASSTERSGEVFYVLV